MQGEQSQWYDDRENLGVLIEYLDNRDDCSISEVLYILEKPWKYAAEFKQALEWKKRMSS